MIMMGKTGLFAFKTRITVSTILKMGNILPLQFSILDVYANSCSDNQNPL